MFLDPEIRIAFKRKKKKEKEGKNKKKTWDRKYHKTAQMTQAVCERDTWNKTNLQSNTGNKPKTNTKQGDQKDHSRHERNRGTVINKTWERENYQ